MFSYIDLLGKKFKYGGRGPEVYDCWGLCREVYRRLGIDVPDFQSSSDFSEIHQKILQGKELLEQLNEPEPYCMVFFTLRPPYVTHIGIVLNPPYFIHILEKSEVAVERLDSITWKKRIAGFYRWKKK